jgi:hypothetical protein
MERPLNVFAPENRAVGPGWPGTDDGRGRKLFLDADRDDGMG